MHWRLVSFFLLTATAASAVRAQTFEIIPSSPDSTQNITMRLSGSWPDSCVPSEPRVAIEGRTIVVRYRFADQICLSVVTAYSREVTIGPLAPGLYTVRNVFTSETKAIAETPLTVREASLPFRIFPHAVSKTTGGPVVIEGAHGGFCESGIPNCDKREVFFGDKAGTADRAIDLINYFTATAPPQNADIVDVKVVYPTGGFDVAKSAFRYFDPAAPPDPALFERILLPITRDVRGAFGSDFRVALNVYNANSYTVPLWRPIGATASLAPSAQIELKSDKPNGALVFPLRVAADRLHFGSNARDVSRVADTFGSEIRVVREKDARTGESELVSIPFDPNFRLNLRLYGIDALPGNMQVALYSLDNRIFYGDTTVPLTSSSPDEPAFGSIPDLRAAFLGVQLTTSGSFRIHLQAPFGFRYWALLTVTNNATQQITTVTPQ